MSSEQEKIWFQAGVASENDRIVGVLEGLAYVDEDGDEMIGEFKDDLIALLRGSRSE